MGVGITAALLIAAVVWGYQMTPNTTQCRSLEYIIEDRSERMYLTENELTQLLRAENIYPVGQELNVLSLYRIEQAVRRHPMVRTAECYITPRNEVKVRLTQRVPLLRVQTPADAYFIDKDRRVMPVRATVKDDVLLVTGAVGVQLASKSLADFAEWLQDNPYWSSRVRYAHVQSPQMVYLYLHHRPRVVMGNMRGFERKLAKLKTLFECGANAIDDKNYTELDVRFHGQVIGRY